VYVNQKMRANQSQFREKKNAMPQTRTGISGYAVVEETPVTAELVAPQHER
jgi:hypothetical protein